MALGGISGWGDVKPPQAEVVTESGGDHSVHVEAQGDTEVTRVGDNISNYKGEHGHLGYWPVPISVEIGGGYHRNPPKGKCRPPLFSAWVTRGREMGTTTLDMKLVQELDSMDQFPHVTGIPWLQKTYDTVDRGCFLSTLEGYVSGPHMCRLLYVFWDQQEVFTRQKGYQIPHFKVIWGTTQGGIISPTLIDLIVNNVVIYWLALTVEDQLVAHKGLGLAIGRCLRLFYSDDGVVGLRYLEWLQGALNLLIGIFRRYKLVMNVESSKAMAYQMGTLSSGMSEEAVVNRRGGNVPQAAENTDPLPRLRSITYHGIDDGTQTVDTWDGAWNLLEPASCHSDGTNSTDIWRQFPKGHVAAPMPIYRLPRVVTDLERPEENF